MPQDDGRVYPKPSRPQAPPSGMESLGSGLVVPQGPSGGKTETYIIQFSAFEEVGFVPYNFADDRSFRAFHGIPEPEVGVDDAQGSPVPRG